MTAMKFQNLMKTNILTSSSTTRKFYIYWITSDSKKDYLLKIVRPSFSGSDTSPNNSSFCQLFSIFQEHVFKHEKIKNHPTGKLQPFSGFHKAKIFNNLSQVSNLFRRGNLNGQASENSLVFRIVFRSSFLL